MKLSVKMLATIAVAVSLGSAAETMKFPQQKNYNGCIKPDVTQAAMDKAVLDYYKTYYKGKFLKQSTTVTSGYFYDSKGAGAGGTSGLTVSEQHGYGMMITALMAGPNGDPEAKKIFDGMYKFWKKFPSPESNGYLMDWLVTTGEKGTGKSSATDGDLDIAYAMLLANAQWGGSPEGASESYTDVAKKILNELRTQNVTTQYRVNLGDWGTSALDTRPSDWMPDHFRSFAKVADANVWNSVSDTVYSLISQITSGYASSTGLMPDFVTASPAKPDASGGGTTGEASNTQYGWNACRYPWRIATDYAMWGTASAKTAMVKVTDFISGKYSDPAEILGGPYTLAGTTAIKNNENAFSAPFIAGAIVDSKYQTYLNKGWAHLQTHNDESDAYGAAIKLMSMMVISGNWWKPTDSPTGNITGPDTTVQFTLDDFANGITGQTDLGASVGAKKYGTTIDKDSCGLWYVWQDKEAKLGKGTTFTNMSGTTLASVENGANNAGDMMTGGVMGFKISKGTADNDWAGLGVSFGQSKGVKDLALDYYDLSKLSAILVRIKGTGSVRLNVMTKDVDAVGYGYYGTEITGITDQWQTIVVDPATFAPEEGSDAAKKLMKWNDGKTQCHGIGIDAATQVCNIEIDYIKLCGVTESTFGLDAVVGNKAPTGINLTNTSVKSDIATGSVVATVAVTDPNQGDTHTLKLKSGGDKFEISGKDLKTKTALTPGSYDVTIEAKDNGGLTYDQTFAIKVVDAAANNAPTDIMLSSLSVLTTDGAGKVVGTLTAKDADAGDTHTYSIVSGSEFTISGNELKTTKTLAAGEYNVVVKVTDKAGASLDKPFTIVSAEPEAPKTLLEELGWYAYSEETTDIANSTLTGGVFALDYDALVKEGIVHCDFTMGKSDEKLELYPVASLTYDTLVVDGKAVSFEKSATITLTYKSDGAFVLSLPNELTDADGLGDEFTTTLASGEKTVTINLNSTTFKQGGWGAKVAFDKTKMYSLSFSPAEASYGKTSYIEISDIKIDGIVGIKDDMKKLALPNQLMMNLTGSKMNIAAPRAGTYTVSLYSVDGRLLKDVQVQLNAGQNSISWNGSDFGSKMIISRIQGAGLSMTQKFLIK